MRNAWACYRKGAALVFAARADLHVAEARAGFEHAAAMDRFFGSPPRILFCTEAAA